MKLVSKNRVQRAEEAVDIELATGVDDFHILTVEPRIALCLTKHAERTSYELGRFECQFVLTCPV
jgi:hypothetical protein